MHAHERTLKDALTFLIEASTYILILTLPQSPSPHHRHQDNMTMSLPSASGQHTRLQPQPPRWTAAVRSHLLPIQPPHTPLKPQLPFPYPTPLLPVASACRRWGVNVLTALMSSVNNEGRENKWLQLLP